uniref:Uncharacterized protein n=1 Tax=Pyxicephalus adspersus TaxID=30357 RepID=A0AAV3A7L2_PYXAD|nr:TPA: hypothetical protein GDO54_018242 [Pyxicephalus adspersus]
MHVRLLSLERIVKDPFQRCMKEHCTYSCSALWKGENERAPPHCALTFTFIEICLRIWWDGSTNYVGQLLKMSDSHLMPALKR